MGREERLAGNVSDDSVLELAGRLAAPGSSPSQQRLGDELRRRVHHAIAELTSLFGACPSELPGAVPVITRRERQLPAAWSAS